MRRVLLVGATGSIGRSTLDVVRALAPELQLHGIFSASNAAALGAIGREFGVRWAGVAEEAALPALREALPGVRTGAGDAFLREAIADPQTDIVVSAASGAAGLPASLEAVRRGKRLALANKESMVLAGPILLRLAEESGATILPVDSEHSAVFQAMQAGRPGEVARILLTASGGPFRTWSREELARATPEDALRHPTWQMGRKITVDSATLMNKALEIVEARWLFGIPAERIEVVVHPQSIVHSLVEFVDGAVLAQMGRPDMRIPIQVALTWPDRRPPAFTRFHVEDYRQLTFEEPDRDRFPALALGERAARRGGTAGAVLNAANEVCVRRFLAGEIAFPAIARRVGEILERAGIVDDPTLDDIMGADHNAREEASK